MLLLTTSLRKGASTIRVHPVLACTQTRYINQPSGKVTSFNPIEPVDNVPHQFLRRTTYRRHNLRDHVMSGMVTVGPMRSVEPHEILDIIPRHTVRHYFRHNNKHRPFVLILVSARFAHLALDKEFPELVWQKVSGPKFVRFVDTYVAVVDKLPSPTGSPSGADGIAYAVNWHMPPHFSQVRAQYDPAAQKPGHLTFRILRTPTRPFETGLQLPLAQTTFLTGRSSTLVKRTYQHDDELGHKTLMKEEFLQSHVFPLMAAAGPLEFKLPLVPLTPARIVVNSMGNILRQLSSQSWADYGAMQKVPKDPDSHTALPASQELEQAVSNFFGARFMTPQPVQVWALVVPPHAAAPAMSSSFMSRQLMVLHGQDLRDMWAGGVHTGVAGANTPDVTALLVQQGIAQLLRQGARLCKVLSGGGGWGTKAGLLSLDPDTDYSLKDIRSEAGWTLDFDDIDALDRIQGFGEVVKTGDSVMFFIAPNEKLPSAPLTKIPNPTLRLIFGAIPSSVDAPAAATAPDSMEPTDTETDNDDAPAAATAPEYVESADTETDNEFFHSHGLFGMLSEGGLAFGFDEKLGTENIPLKPTAKENAFHGGNEAEQPIYNLPPRPITKVDVPFATISILESPESDPAPAMVVNPLKRRSGTPEQLYAASTTIYYLSQTQGRAEAQDERVEQQDVPQGQTQNISALNLIDNILEQQSESDRRKG